MLIVPDDDALKVEARIAPQDVDEIHAGATVRVRFPAFSAATPRTSRAFSSPSRRAWPPTSAPGRSTMWPASPSTRRRSPA
ncbi:hypothetical protein [Xanthobacter autotrophicus]|uniref:hypothetical protein n=1 Tax=Xanthobacter autotrophicus TaxID=280 RepID=UPI00372D09AE